jgi:hypothetical protein
MSDDNAVELTAEETDADRVNVEIIDAADPEGSTIIHNHILKVTGEPATVKEQREMRGDLAKKLLAVAAQVGTIEQKGFNAHFKYHFAKASDITREVCQALSDHGVMPVPYVNEETDEDKGKTNSGATKLLTKIVGRVEFIDTETGFSISVPLRGRGLDTEDKGYNKALTAAYKYLFKTMFLIETAEQEKNDTDGQGRNAGQPKPKQATKADLKKLRELMVEKGVDEEQVLAQVKAVAGYTGKIEDMPQEFCLRVIGGLSKVEVDNTPEDETIDADEIAEAADEALSDGEG